MSATVSPNRFKRSSERVDPAAERALREWAFKDAAEEARALEDYEALSYGLSSASAASMTVDVVAEQRAREASSEYELTGRVY